MSVRKKITPLKLRHERLRKRIAGTAARPRLSVHFSGNHIYAQIINDDAGVTIASASTTEKLLKAKGKLSANSATAKLVGSELASRAKSKGVSSVVFDRGGFLYHGKVKALADAAREVGLNF